VEVGPVQAVTVGPTQAVAPIPVVTDGVPVHETSVEEGRALLDKLARELLGMSGEDFVGAWDRGEFEGSDDPDVVRVGMLMPFVR